MSWSARLHGWRKEVPLGIVGMVSRRMYAGPGRVRSATVVPIGSRERSQSETVEQARGQLVAWASDDMVVPLIELRALVQSVEAGAVDDPAEVRLFHRKMLGEIDRLTDLVADLGVLATVKTQPAAIDRFDHVFDLAFQPDRYQPASSPSARSNADAWPAEVAG